MMQFNSTDGCETILVCHVHGRMHGNLCVRCLAKLVGYSPIIDPRDFFFATISDIGNHILKPTFRLVWKLVKVIAYIVSSCFVCFFMMWFIQPDISPEEKERRAREDERKRKEDDEWFEKRDADHERRNKEQREWEQDRELYIQQAQKKADKFAEEFKKDTGRDVKVHVDGNGNREIRVQVNSRRTGINPFEDVLPDDDRIFGKENLDGLAQFDSSSEENDED